MNSLALAVLRPLAVRKCTAFEGARGQRGANFIFKWLGDRNEKIF